MSDRARPEVAAGLAPYSGGVFAVTGGADGIGFALAERAVAYGMRPAILDVRQGAAEQAAARLGGAARAYGCDVSEPEELAGVADRLGGEDVPRILWINAGVGTLGGFLGASRLDIEWVYQVNVLGAIRTARALVPGMLASGLPCHIGITASSSALAAANSVYAASKHAVLAIGEALRDELTPAGVGVTLLIPGRATTRIWDGARARPARFGGPASLPDRVGEGWRTALPPGHVADAAFACVSRGGGYCVLLPSGGDYDGTEDRVRQLDERSETIRQAVVTEPAVTSDF
jgi:NAD(P)-dependent dehydrogenase (short-subunit alcohol dehydrogenase family)